MKATQGNFAGPDCFSDMPILRRRNGDVAPAKTLTLEQPDTVPSAMEVSRIPRMSNGCLECKTLANAAQVVSHDLRNHLTAICSNVEFISESRTTDLEREESVGEVRGVVRDITRMLDSFLLLAKTGRPLHPSWRCLNQVVDHAASMVRAHPDARNVDLVIQDAAPIECWMDDTKVGSAVYNLLLNACQAVQLGPAFKRVQVTLAEDRKFAHLWVIDSGCGVPSAIRKTLFQPFVSAQRSNGTGLGLSIVDCTAREHCGYADLEDSAPGRTVFGFHISKYALEDVTTKSQP